MSDKNKKILEDAEREGIPIFVLIAKDNESIGTLQRYLNDCEWDGCSDEHIEGIKSKLLNLNNGKMLILIRLNCQINNEKRLNNINRFFHSIIYTMLGLYPRLSSN